MTHIFEATTRPNSDLFYQRQDANDRRLGEQVQSIVADYDRAEVVILGCPQDEGVRRNGGRVGAAQAPDAIRRCLYKLTVNQVEHVRLFDLGNTIIQPTLEETHALHQQVVRQVLEDGKTLVVLGGGNDVSYPDCSGMAQVFDSVLAFNVDSHYDVRADAVRNSGTPYRQLIEEGIINPAHLYEMCNQPFANSPVYTRYLEDKGAHIFPLKEVQAHGIIRTFEQIIDREQPGTIFWGLDMDVVRAADAPGVSAPNAGGLTGSDLYDIAGLAGGYGESRLLEICEVNPSFDIDERTSRLAAVVIYSFLSAR